MNEFRGNFEIQVGGKTRVLRFDHNALAELQGAVGVPFTQMFSDQASWGFLEHRGVVWAGLLHAEPKLSIRTVGDWLTPLISDSAQYSCVVQAALDALMAVFPKPKEDVAKKNTESPAEAGTGNDSLTSVAKLESVPSSSGE